MPEAKLTRTEHGVKPDGEGWFVLNTREVPWSRVKGLGAACFFEGEPRFPEVGFNVNVLPPGDAGAMYHSEGSQEGFLVLAGEGIAIVEGQERPLEAWDFFHCPAGTPHVLVAAGDTPFVYVAVGSRGPEKEGSLHYPVDQTALRHRAGVREPTTEAKTAYAGLEVETGPYRDGDLPDYDKRSAR
jgi:uncharacterized cupin superfamily protein